MPYDTQQVAEAIEMMRDALALLDRAGAGSTGFAFHLSLAVEVADGPAAESPLHYHDFDSVDPSETEVGV